MCKSNDIVRDFLKLYYTSNVKKYERKTNSKIYGKFESALLKCEYYLTTSANQLGFKTGHITDCN